MAGPPGKCFLVTGPPGIGKTTLIKRLLDTLKSSNPNLKLQGFYTSEVRRGNERVRFEVVTLDGRKGPLASTSIQSQKSLRWPTVGRYRVDIASFESLALPELQVKNDLAEFASIWSCIYTNSHSPDSARSEATSFLNHQVKEDTDLFVIDEVGKMELFSSTFFPAVLQVLDSNIPLLASVPLPKSGRDIPAVARLKNHPGATIFTLNTTNRDAIREHIYSALVSLLPKH